MKQLNVLTQLLKPKTSIRRLQYNSLKFGNNNNGLKIFLFRLLKFLTQCVKEDSKSQKKLLFGFAIK